MKKSFLIIFGNEIRWFNNLPLKHRLIVNYTVLSATLVISVWNSNIWINIIMVFNLLNALRLAKGVDGKGLEE